jgi:hypothetical protein
MCSEIFGLDDEVSMDHEWGPRVSIFLSEQDHLRCAKEIDQAFKKLLPMQFKGFDMMWRKPGVDVHKTRKTILYHVGATTVQDTLNFYGGIKTLHLNDMDWLKISEQHLLEFTSGVVYKDDVGVLTRCRELLAYYPPNVLKFLLMREWYAIGGDWFPIGRIGSRGDALGLRIQVAKITQRFMRIAFMVNKTYFPYKKWFGMFFKRLPIAPQLEPMLLDLLAEDHWQQVEEKIGEITLILLAHQNNLGITSKITLKKAKVDDGRHHIDIGFWQIGNQLAKYILPPLKSLTDNEVFWLHERNLILWNEEVGKWTLLLQK